MTFSAEKHAKGLLLVLEGGDGSGKSSQRELLSEFFRKSGRVVEAIHFPRLAAQPYGDIIADFLRGGFGGVDAVHPKLAALLYALDRAQAARAMKAVLDGGAVIVADRYLFSNIAYQCAKVPPPERDGLADWIEKLEYHSHGIPRPDLTLYLDVPPDFARANLAKTRVGKDREYLRGGARDIHEASADLQSSVRDIFLRLAKTRPGEIGVVDCRDVDGGMADKATVHSRIVDALRYYGVISR